MQAPSGDMAMLSSDSTTASPSSSPSPDVANTRRLSPSATVAASGNATAPTCLKSVSHPSALTLNPLKDSAAPSVLSSPPQQTRPSLIASTAAVAAPARELTPAAAAALNAPTHSGFRHAKTVLAFSEKGPRGGPREPVTSVISSTTASSSTVIAGGPVLRYRTDLDKPVIHFMLERLGRPIEEICVPWRDEDERDANTAVGDWHFFWMSVSRVRNVFSGSSFRANDNQIVNHFPNHYELTRKDLMYRNIKRYLRENSSASQSKKLSLLTAADWVAAASNGAASSSAAAVTAANGVGSPRGIYANGTGIPSGLSSGNGANQGRQTIFHFADSVPITYNIPADMSMFIEEFKRHPGATWIVKPTSRSQGKGIFLINRIQQLTRWIREKKEVEEEAGGLQGMTGGATSTSASAAAGGGAGVADGSCISAGGLGANGGAAPFRVSGPAPNAPTVAAQAGSPSVDPNYVAAAAAAAAAEKQKQEHLNNLIGTFIVSKYIANPLLIGGKKFDMRLYVLVTSYKPLVAYLHEGGFARFCATKYVGNSLSEDDLGSHLTNVALQKGDEHYNTTHGGKWSLKNLFLYLQGRNGPYVAEGLMANIAFLIYHSLKAMESVIFNDKHCFELYGYDILVDENVKPHLIEVNASPSLSTTTTSDRLLKEEVLSDMLKIVLPPGYPSSRAPTYYEHRTRTDLTTQMRTGFRLLQFP